MLPEVLPGGQEAAADQLVQEVLHLLRGLTAQPGKDVEFRTSDAVGRVGCQDQSGELHRGRHPARRDQRNRA